MTIMSTSLISNFTVDCTPLYLVFRTMKDDQKEGMAAFTEKRAPEWTHK